MNKIIVIIILILCSLNIYSKVDNDTIICIKIKKEKLQEVKQILKTNNITIIKQLDPLKFQIREKKKKKWITEFKVSIGMGATYGLIYQTFDVGPSINLGYEFTF